MEQWEQETRDHINKVGLYLQHISEDLLSRAVHHDKSKLEDPEKSIFMEYTSKLKGMTYGSDEYKQCLKEMKPALDHHYENNRHHPEHYQNGIHDMSLITIIEMLMDWYAASQRHADGDIYKSIEINSERFGYSDELKQIFINTIDEMKRAE